MSTQKVYPVYSFQYIQNKLVELSRQKLNSADVTPQEQADWTETDTFSPAYIKNKPSIPAVIGDVVGPSSSVTNNIVLFNGTTGKLIKDSGVNLSQYQLVLNLTTTGNSGSATLNGGTATLNIPNYTLAGLGGIGLSSLSASTPLSYNNTTGAFSIQVANTSQNGYLTSMDWNTFNNKQSALGFTPVPTTRTLTINGTAYDLSADRSWTISSGGMTNPMTTAGDIIYGGASGTPTRLGIGTSGFILQAGASAPTWFNLFGTANTFTTTQTILWNNGVSRSLILNAFTGSASATSFSGAAGTAVSFGSGNFGIMMTHNASFNSPWIYPIFTIANRSLLGYTATVPQIQLRISTLSGTNEKNIEWAMPTNSTFTAYDVAIRYDLFSTSSSYRFAQYYMKVAIDTAGAVTPSTALFHLGAAASGYAQMNLKSSAGTNPTTQADGDVWYDGLKLSFYGNGQKQELQQVQASVVATDFSVTSSTTLVNVTGLTANMTTGRTYRFEAMLYTTANGLGGIRSTINGTVGVTTLVYDGILYNSTTIAQARKTTTLGQLVGVSTTASVGTILIRGTIKASSNGAFNIQFAQNVSDPGASTVLAGSYLQVTQIA
jgi:hypothetical protein